MVLRRQANLGKDVGSQNADMSFGHSPKFFLEGIGRKIGNGHVLQATHLKIWKEEIETSANFPGRIFLPMRAIGKLTENFMHPNPASHTPNQALKVPKLTTNEFCVLFCVKK